MFSFPKGVVVELEYVQSAPPLPDDVWCGACVVPAASSSPVVKVLVVLAGMFDIWGVPLVREFVGLPQGSGVV